MKKILFVLFSLLLISNICFADENWEYVGDVKEFKVSVDTYSFNTAKVDSYNILKLMIKMENFQSGEYQINSFELNKDTKNWKLAHMDYFNKYGIMIDSQDNNNPWESYDNPSWKPIIDEIVKRAK